MASPYPTSAHEIYDWLEADSALAALLGTYRLSDGSVQPALVCLWPTDAMPPGVQVFGVEVVIWRQRSSAPALQVTGEQRLNPTWRLTVTQWQSETIDEPTYEAVLDRLIELLPGAIATDVTLPGTTNGLAQATVRWSNPTVALAPLDLED